MPSVGYVNTGASGEAVNVESLQRQLPAVLVHSSAYSVRPAVMPRIGKAVSGVSKLSMMSFAPTVDPIFR